MENRLPPIPTMHDLVDRPGTFDAQLTRHDNLLPPRRICVNGMERPLYARPTKAATDWGITTAPEIRACAA
jgi:hypothetical protein